MKILRGLRALFRRNQIEREMAEEMRLHLELQTERNAAAGMELEEARYAAHRQFGGVEQIKERCREARGWTRLEDTFQDIRYSWRQLRKAPSFTATIVMTLALGIGATTAVFSIVHSVLLQPLDFPDSSRLVAPRETYPPNNEIGEVTWAAYCQWRERATSFENIAGSRSTVGNLTGVGEPERASILEVTPSYFATLQIQPIIGRDFRADEETPGKNNVIILSHVFWLTKFSGEPSVVGRSVRLSDRSCLVVGVLPANEQLDMIAGVYTPIAASADRPANHSPRDGIDVVARLRPGVGLKQVTAELEAIAAAMSQTAPATHKGRGAKVTSLLDDVVKRSNYGMIGAESLLLLLLAAVGLLLLIAGVNVTNLLLLRASRKRREIALRVTLGATRERIVRQLLCESLLLSSFGGLAGVAFAYWGLWALKPLTGDLPRAQGIAIDAQALGVSAAIVLLIGVVFGLYPALQASRPDLVGRLNDGNNSVAGLPSGRARKILIVAEVTLAIVLVSGAGLLVNSFVRLKRVDLGFRPEGVFANRLELPAQRYSTPTQQLAFVDRVLSRMTELRQVNSAAFTTGMPIFGSLGCAFQIKKHESGPDPAKFWASYAAVSPEFFRTLGILLIRGRSFSPTDSPSAQSVALVSVKVAERYFPNQDPVGQYINLTSEPNVWREVVGIVADVKQWGPASDTIAFSPGYVYVPYGQNPIATNLMLVVRATGDANDLPATLRSVIQAEDTDLPLTRLFRMTDGVGYSIARFRLSMWICALFAASAVLLAAVGIYGLVSSSVSERTREIGVRVALGAQRRDIFRLILHEIVGLVSTAVAFGVIGAFAGTRFLRSLLFDVSAHDPVTFALAIVVLVLVAFLASWFPARRAAKVDPVIALRSE